MESGTDSPDTDSAIGARELRNALGQFATGVCVVSINTEGRDPIGITINSFSSVSLDPPLILWSIESSADIFPYVDAAESFGINILGFGQQELSVHYADNTRHRIDDDTYRLSKNGIPLLNGCIATLECLRHGKQDGGDHEIILGRVISVAIHGGEPLIFYGSEYRRLQGR
jgi:flavin reductase (DIM6/NTAB) family NADH-FMN oxidoreductase RutF